MFEWMEKKKSWNIDRTRRSCVDCIHTARYPLRFALLFRTHPCLYACPSLSSVSYLSMNVSVPYTHFLGFLVVWYSIFTTRKTHQATWLKLSFSCYSLLLIRIHSLKERWCLDFSHTLKHPTTAIFHTHTLIYSIQFSRTLFFILFRINTSLCFMHHQFSYCTQCLLSVFRGLGETTKRNIP